MDILIAEPEQYSPHALARYNTLGSVHASHTLSRAELLSEVALANVLVVRLAHVIDKEVIDSAPQLKIIASPTTGLNHIDVAYAQSKGIAVISLQGETAFLKTVHATAELTLALMLSLVRKLPWNMMNVVRQRRWDRDSFKGFELEGKTLGIIGCGRLGSIVGGYGKAFGMRVIARDPNIQEITHAGFESVSLEELLAHSDIVSLHAPLNDSTKGMVSVHEFLTMKQGAWFINTARGELVNETALLNALTSGHLGGAALDVLADELAWGASKQIFGNGSSAALLDYAATHHNLIITSHIGGATFESMAKTENFIAEKVTNALRSL